MIGLAYVAFFVVYFSISALVIFFGYRFAKRRYRKGWAGGWYWSLGISLTGLPFFSK